MLHDDGLGEELSRALRSALLKYIWSAPVDYSIGPERAENIDYEMALLRQQHGIDLGPRLRSDSIWEHPHELPRELSELLQEEVAGSPIDLLETSMAVVTVVAEQRLLYIDEEKLIGHLFLHHAYVPSGSPDIDNLLLVHGSQHQSAAQ